MSDNKLRHELVQQLFELNHADCIVCVTIRGQEISKSPLLTLKGETSKAIMVNQEVDILIGGTKVLEPGCCPDLRLYLSDRVKKDSEIQNRIKRAILDIMDADELRKQSWRAHLN